MYVYSSRIQHLILTRYWVLGGFIVMDGGSVASFAARLTLTDW